MTRKDLLAFAGVILAKSVERHWRKLDGTSRVRQLIEGVDFRTASQFKMPRQKPPPDPLHQD